MSRVGNALQRYRARTPLPLSAQAGILVVAAAAAVISFDGLRALGIRAGIPGEIAWLLPVSVDAAAAVAVVIWLTFAVPAVAKEAKRLAYVAIAVSVLGNAAEHGLSVLGVVLPLPALVGIAALVGAIAPGMFGAIIHLGVSAIRRDREPLPRRVPQPVPPPVPPTLYVGAGRLVQDEPPDYRQAQWGGPELVETSVADAGYADPPPAPPAPPVQPDPDPETGPVPAPVPLRAVPDPPKARTRKELEAAGEPFGIKRKAGETVDSLRERVEEAERAAREEGTGR